jgi:outer membrane protein assembly factor BamB
MATQPLVIGVGGYALSIDPTTGEEIWRSEKLGNDIVSVHIQDGRMFAGTRGVLFALDPATGALLWKNKLKGLGHGLVTFDNGDGSGEARAEGRKKAAAAAAAAS